MPGFWRKCRIALRCVRFTVWAVILISLAAFVWFNHVGLPGFLKTRLVAALHQRGIQLEFSRMRLRVFRGFVCDNVRIRAVDNPGSPMLAAREVQLRVDYLALLRLHLQVDGLVLRQGKLDFPLAANNSLALTNLQGELRILPEDTWSLDQFRADLAGATFTLAGGIAHAPEFRNWKMFAGAKAPDHGSVQASLQGFSDTLKQIHFAGKTQLNVRLDGDARDVHSFTCIISAQAPGVQTPWFSVSNLEFAAHVLAPTNAPLYAGPAYGFWTNLQPFRLDWFARGTNFKSSKLSADIVDCSGAWGDPRDVRAFATTVNARARGVQTPWFSLYDLDLAARVLTPTNLPHSTDPSWGFWTNLQPFEANWLARGADLKSPKLTAHSVACSGTWIAPELTFAELSGRLGGGMLDARADLNVASRALNFSANSTFDPHAVAALLTDELRARLKEISWPKPPQIHAGGTLVLPMWAERTPDWMDDMESGMKVHGDLAFTNAQVAGIGPPVSVQTHFGFTNLVLQLPDLQLAHGRTSLKLSGEASEVTRNFHCMVEGKLATESVLPFLSDSNAVHGFEHLQFREPVSLALDASGNLRQFTTLSVTGRVAAANFAIRDQWVDSVAATLSYTNLTAEFFHPQLTRANGAEKFTAEKLTLDIVGQKLFLLGGKGRVLPLAVARAIGPKTAEAMDPYQFLTIPEATVNGCIPLKQRNGDLVPDDADLRFDVIGTAPFRWRKFQTPAITGTIHWRSNYLILTNVVSECYGGTAHGWGVFDLLTPGDGTDFSFFMDGTNVDFNAMGRALWSPTNQLRGALSGNVMVTKANSSDWRTWNGYGQARLQDGLLWNAPIFGMMSPVLNTLTPGLDIGNSRATDGNGRFTMTNGVIFTDSLEIRSLAMRLDYVGTVDLEENVRARVKAELLRNTPVIGSLVSTVLMPVSKVFECEVTGTLDQPKITPLYIPFPKVLSAPLHPIRTVEQIFSAPPTNTPPKP